MNDSLLSLSHKHRWFRPGRITSSHQDPSAFYLVAQQPQHTILTFWSKTVSPVPVFDLPADSAGRKDERGEKPHSSFKDAFILSTLHFLHPIEQNLVVVMHLLKETGKCSSLVCYSLLLLQKNEGQILGTVRCLCDKFRVKDHERHLTCTPMFPAALFTAAKTWSSLNAHRRMNG